MPPCNVFNGILLGRSNSSASETNVALNDSISTLNKEITDQKNALSAAKDSNDILRIDLIDLLKEIEHGARENKNIKAIKQSVVEKAKEDTRK